MNDALNHFIDMNRQNILDDLSAIVTVPSVSSDLSKVSEALDKVLELGRRMGFSAERLLDGQIGIVEIGEGNETVGILTHVDVVPAGDRDQWHTDPFQAVVRDGRIYGRGTLDDKGMIVASLYAMKAVKEQDIPLKKKIRLIIGTQEETSWTDMEKYTRSYPLPDYGFTPDGEYPICNIEKGGADIMMGFDISDEVSGLHLVSIDCGQAANAVPAKASAVLSDGSEIVAYGRAVHSCQPEKGENALFALAEKLETMDLVPNKLLLLLRKMTAAFKDIYGRSVGLYSSSEYYCGEYVHRNVFSITIFKAEGSQCLVNINGRTAYGTSGDEVLDRFRQFAQAAGGTIKDCNILPAVFVSKEKPFLQALASAYEDITGQKNEFTLAYGGSYAKAMPNIVSWGPIFTGEEDTCHQPDEYISCKSLMDNAKIFAQALFNLAISEKSFK